MPPHEPGADFWGLGGFGWNGNEVETRQRSGKSKWQSIPVLWENNVEKEDEEFAGEVGLGANMVRQLQDPLTLACHVVVDTRA